MHWKSSKVRDTKVKMAHGGPARKDLRDRNVRDAWKAKAKTVQRLCKDDRVNLGCNQGNKPSKKRETPVYSQEV